MPLSLSLSVCLTLCLSCTPPTLLGISCFCCLPCVLTKLQISYALSLNNRRMLSTRYSTPVPRHLLQQRTPRYRVASPIISLFVSFPFPDDIRTNYHLFLCVCVFVMSLNGGCGPHHHRQLRSFAQDTHAQGAEVAVIHHDHLVVVLVLPVRPLATLHGQSSECGRNAEEKGCTRPWQYC